MKTAAKDFKMTELGPIPKDWEVKRLGEIGTFSKGSGISRDQAHTGWLPCIRYGEIYTDHNDWIRDFKSHITSEIAAGAKLLNAGDILFAGSGETKEEIGKAVAYLGGEKNAYCGGDILVLSPHSEHSSKYLGYVLNSRPVVVQKASRGQGDAVVHIKADSLAEVSAPIPPLPEQRKIAAALSDVDEMIAASERLIEKKRKIKTGAMQRLLTGKTRLPGFKGAWVEKRLGDVCATFVSGATPCRGVKSYWGGHIRWITSGELNYNVIYETNEHITPKGVRETNLIVHKPGTLLIAMTGMEAEGTRGRCAIVGAPSTTNQSCLALNGTDRCDALFLYWYYVYKGKDLALTFCQGTKQQSYTADIVRRLPVVLPPTLAEQKAIAKVLGDMDAEIAALEAELAKTRQLKQGMMQELLTGKVRLR